MIIFRAVRNFVVLAVLAFLVAAIAPVGAGEVSACNMTKADAFRAAGDRYRAMGSFSEAAHWYLAASRYSQRCRSADSVLVNAKSLAQAGSALAQSGDYLRGRSLLETAQSRLTSIGGANSPVASAARLYVDLVQNMITAIDRVAEASM